MRLFYFNDVKFDKKFFIFAIIAAICGTILGIVLYSLTQVSLLFWNYTKNYVWYIFSFNSGALIFSHILSETVILYLFFLIGYFTKYKYLSLILIIVRCAYFAIYTALLIELNVLGGITIAIFIFIPISLISLSFYYLVLENCNIFNKKLIFFIPIILALINTLIFLFLINVVFRVVIVIV